MLEIKTNFRWQQAVPRILADFIVVHASAIVSLVVVFLWHVHTDPQLPAGEAALTLQDYYLRIFLPLSLIFPIVFVWSGFYARARGFRSTYKWQVIWRNSVLAALIFLFANFLLTRADVLPRSATVLFLLLVTSGTIASRWVKYWLVDRDGVVEPIVFRREENAPVLVVGGAGYIGSILVRKLLDAGKRVRVLDSLVYGSGAIREILGHPDLELIKGDCRNIQNVVCAVKGVDSIVHLAAIVGDPACEQDRLTALEVNYSATRMLIEVAKGAGVRRFVFASSCSVYGASDQLMEERSEVKPISLYAETKVQSERALLEARSESFHPVILRIATVFGNSYRPRFDLVVNLLTAKAHQERTIVIYNGDQWRPFIHVRDVAEGMVVVLQAPLSIVGGEIFNLGDSRLNYTLTQVAETIRKFFPGTVIEYTENGDRRNYRVSFEKIRHLTGFKAGSQLEDGIGEIKKAFEEGLIADYRDPLYSNLRFLQRAGAPANHTELDRDLMASFARSWDLRNDAIAIR